MANDVLAVLEGGVVTESVLRGIRQGGVFPHRP
jgi:hypothetical protein